MELRTLVVGVADCKVSGDESVSLITYALGSCVAVAIHDPVTRVGGMLHFMLPESSLDRDLARQNPYMFADTGIPLLFRNAYKEGAKKGRLVVRVLGGAQVLEGGGIFDIGKRNYQAARKLLMRAAVRISGELVGGSQWRTVRLEVGNGRTMMRTAECEEVLG